MLYAESLSCCYLSILISISRIHTYWILRRSPPQLQQHGGQRDKNSDSFDTKARNFFVSFIVLRIIFIICFVESQPSS